MMTNRQAGRRTSLGTAGAVKPKLRQICRNVTVNGRRTSIRMETAYWDGLKQICDWEDKTLN